MGVVDFARPDGRGGMDARRLAVCIALVGGALTLLACGPRGRTPGFRLFGDVVQEPVGDWSFADAYPTIEVETRTWYGIPHSVTTVSFRDGGSLYVPSRNPRDKRWVKNVQRNPRVRLRIGDRVYEGHAILISDPERVAELRRALSARFDRLRTHGDQPELWFFRIDQGRRTSTMQK